MVISSFESSGPGIYDLKITKENNIILIKSSSFGALTAVPAVLSKSCSNVISLDPSTSSSLLEQQLFIFRIDVTALGKLISKHCKHESSVFKSFPRKAQSFLNYFLKRFFMTSLGKNYKKNDSFFSLPENNFSIDYQVSGNNSWNPSESLLANAVAFSGFAPVNFVGKSGTAVPGDAFVVSINCFLPSLANNIGDSILSIIHEEYFYNCLPSFFQASPTFMLRCVFYSVVVNSTQLLPSVKQIFLREHLGSLGINDSNQLVIIPDPHRQASMRPSSNSFMVAFSLSPGTHVPTIDHNSFIKVGNLAAPIGIINIKADRCWDSKAPSKLLQESILKSASENRLPLQQDCVDGINSFNKSLSSPLDLLLRCFNYSKGIPVSTTSPVLEMQSSPQCSPPSILSSRPLSFVNKLPDGCYNWKQLSKDNLDKESSYSSSVIKSDQAFKNVDMVGLPRYPSSPVKASSSFKSPFLASNPGVSEKEVIKTKPPLFSQSFQLKSKGTKKSKQPLSKIAEDFPVTLEIAEDAPVTLETAEDVLEFAEDVPVTLEFTKDVPVTLEIAEDVPVISKGKKKSKRPLPKGAEDAPVTLEFTENVPVTLEFTKDVPVILASSSFKVPLPVAPMYLREAVPALNDVGLSTSLDDAQPIVLSKKSAISLSRSPSSVATISQTNDLCSPKRLLIQSSPCLLIPSLLNVDKATDNNIVISSLPIFELPNKLPSLVLEIKNDKTTMRFKGKVQSMGSPKECFISEFHELLPVVTSVSDLEVSVGMLKHKYLVGVDLVISSESDGGLIGSTSGTLTSSSLKASSSFVVSFKVITHCTDSTGKSKVSKEGPPVVCRGGLAVSGSIDIDSAESTALREAFSMVVSITACLLYPLHKSVYKAVSIGAITDRQSLANSYNGYARISPDSMASHDIVFIKSLLSRLQKFLYPNKKVPRLMSSTLSMAFEVVVNFRHREKNSDADSICKKLLGCFTNNVFNVKNLESPVYNFAGSLFSSGDGLIFLA